LQENRRIAGGQRQDREGKRFLVFRWHHDDHHAAFFNQALLDVFAQK
jgi:hypothetical protein